MTVPSYTLPSSWTLDVTSKPEVREGVAKLIRRARKECRAAYGGETWHWDLKYENGRVFLSDYHDIYKNTDTIPSDTSHLLWWTTSDERRHVHPTTYDFKPEINKGSEESLIQASTSAALKVLDQVLDRQMTEAMEREYYEDQADKAQEAAAQ